MSLKKMFAIILSLTMLLSLIAFDLPLAITEEIDPTGANAVPVATAVPEQADVSFAESADDGNAEPSAVPTIEVPAETAPEVTAEPTSEAAEPAGTGEPNACASADELNATITLDKSTVAVGETITGNWTVTGGTAPYSYEYKWIPWGLGGWGGDYVVDTVTTSSFTPRVGSAGFLNVVVTDATGYKKGFESTKFTITGAPVQELTKCTITLDRTSVDVGDTITANWTATGGIPPYSYYYSWVVIEPNGDITSTSGDTTQTTASFTPQAGVGVKGYLYLEVRDSVGMGDAFNSDDFVIKQMKCAITFDKDTVAVGSEIAANWAVSGGTVPYQYKYTWNLTEENGETIRKSGAGTTASSSYTPLAGVFGTIQVEVIDADGVSQIFESPRFTVTGAAAASPLVASVNLDRTSVTHGKTITATVAASGGTVPYTYDYVWKATEAGGAVSEEKGTSSSATIGYTPSKGTSGLFTVTVNDACERQVAVMPARFSIQEVLYALKLDSAGGSQLGTLMLPYNYSLSGIVLPRKAGYTFAGWIPAIPAHMPAEDITLVAQWTANQYTIAFYSAPCCLMEVIKQACDTAVTAPANPVRYGYTFAGWSPAVPSKMPAEDTACVAQWTINQYRMMFNSQGGSEVNSISQDYNTPVTAPANPTRAGYTFAGWAPAVPDKMPGGSGYHFAQWTPNPYQITFDPNGGSAVNAITQAYDTIVTAPANPTRTGYTFAGWVPAVPDRMCLDVTCTAQWTVNQYRIAFDPNGGSAVNAIEQPYNAAVTAPANPTRLGYAFTGWSPAVPPVMPAENVACVAQWAAITDPITASNVTVGVGQTAKIDYQLHPSGATAAIIAFSTKDKKIATVDANGNIRGVKTGSTTITIDANRIFKCTIKVTVKNAPKSISIKTGKTTLGVGEQTTTAVKLSSGSAGSWTFSSNNKPAATVDADGTVSATGIGSATITAMTHNKKTSTVRITVLAAPSGIALNADTLTLGVGASAALNATLPKNSAGAYHFRSDNTNVATVDANGIVKALSRGTSTITVETYNGKNDTCAVTVVDAPAKVDLSTDRTTIGVGEKLQLGVGVQPKTAFGTPVFSSSKTSVATVSATGLVTAKKAGTATITAQMYNGVKATIKIAVKKAPTRVSIKASKTTLVVGEMTATSLTLSSGSAGSRTYSTSSSSVATVDADGKITAVGVGSATITVLTYNKKTATVKVTVK